MASSMRRHHSLHHCTVFSLSSFDAVHLVTTQPIWKRTNSANKEGKKKSKKAHLEVIAMIVVALMSLSFFYGDVVHWCRYSEDCYKESLSPPTDGAPVEVMFTASRDASL